MIFVKGPFRDPQPHPSIFSKKVEIFTSAEASRYIIFMCKIFLANLFLWRNNRPNCLFTYVDIEITTTVAYVGAYAALRYNKTCITHKWNLRIDWKFENKLILSISTELRHKNIMLGLQNRSLSIAEIYMYDKTNHCLFRNDLPFRTQLAVSIKVVDKLKECYRAR